MKNYLLLLASFGLMACASKKLAPLTFSHSIYDDITCAQPELPANIEKLLTDLSWLDRLPRKNNKFGKMSFSSECKAYPKHGFKDLAADLSAGFKTGLSCLRDLGAERRIDAQKLIAFIANPKQELSFTCGKEGATLGTDWDGALRSIRKGTRASNLCHAFKRPVIAINVDDFAEGSANKNQETLFHESLHLLGYSHNKAFDVTYLASLCCFGSDNSKKAQGLACDLLKGNPPWTSAEYARKFSAVMLRAGFPSIALETAWRSMFKAPLQAGRVDASALYETALEFGYYTPGSQKAKANVLRIGDGFTGLVLGVSAIDNIDDSFIKRKRIEREIGDEFYPRNYKETTAKRRFAESIGQYISKILNNDRDEVIALGPNLKRQADKTCREMSSGEKEALRLITRTTSLAILTIRPFVPREVWLNWENLCVNPAEQRD